jgi:hypothetical protein
MRDLVWTLPFLLYAETHYRFKYFFSFLRKAEPEVIADIPHRIEPNAGIPLLLLAKDADKFPATLTSVRVIMRRNSTIIREIELIVDAIFLTQRMWWKVYELPRDRIHGWLDIEVLLTLATGAGTKIYSADNHRTSSHAPLRIYLSDERLPQESGVHFGDAHTHSDRTDDQVEFGVPIDAAVTLSKAMGLSYFCVADHSYDLDDSVEDYSKNDPSLPKWISLTKEIREKNSKEHTFAVVQGEEVSCRNLKNQNVHLLLFGDEHFFHGSGDGAEQWFQTRCEYSISDILRQKHQGASAYAAHPMEPVSILQRWLLGRGSWSSKDLSNSLIAGIQFANGVPGKGFFDGYHAWIQALLEGRHVYCLAGNDAHGNFNRFRQIGIPFVRVRESNSQLFGKMRTAIIAQERFDQSIVLESLARGNFIATDGPFTNIVLTDSQNIATSIGARLTGSQFEFRLSTRSSKEFGEIKEVKLLVGNVGNNKERVFFSERMSEMFVYERLFSIRVTESMYLRAETYTSNINQSDGCQHFCFTNPIWLSPQSHS